MRPDIVVLSSPRSDDFSIVSPPHYPPPLARHTTAVAGPSASCAFPYGSPHASGSRARPPPIAIEIGSSDDETLPALPALPACARGMAREGSDISSASRERSAADILAEMEALAGPGRRGGGGAGGAARRESGGAEVRAIGGTKNAKGKEREAGEEADEARAEVSALGSKETAAPKEGAGRTGSRAKSDVSDDDAAAPKIKKKRKVDEVDKAAKAEEQRAAKARREADKEKEKEEKRYAREAAKADKEAEKSRLRKLAEVNRIRTSKNDALRDISVHLSPDLFEPASPLAAALPEITTRLSDNGCAVRALPRQPVDGLVRFLRRVRATWDATRRRFVPLPDGEERDEWEAHAVLVCPAEQVVDRVAVSEDELGVWVRDVRELLELGSDTHVLLLITGMAKYHAKTKSLANKRFADEARAGLGGPKSKKSVDAAGRVSRDTVEKELVRVQIEEKVFIVQVDKTEDLEDWVYNLAGDIALKPHKLVRKAHLPFSAPEHARKAATPRDALEAMLQEVQGVTASAAAGISVGHASFAALMRAYERAEARGGAGAGLERAEAMLVDCEVRARVDGASSGRKLGKAMSKRVYSVMRGTDPYALA